MKVARKINPLTLSSKEIDTISDLVLDQCRYCIDHNLVLEKERYIYGWLSRKKTMKKKPSEFFKPIKKLERIKDHIIQNINQDNTLTMRHVSSGGAQYNNCTTSVGQEEWIDIPYPNRFILPKYYYQTLIHELAHASVEDTRLNLKIKTTIHDEFIAETSSLIICFMSGYNVWCGCIDYLNQWCCKGKYKSHIKSEAKWDRFRSDTKAIVRYMLGK